MLESGGPLSKRYIASVLWPEADLERARDCLYKTLSWLRAEPELYGLFGLDAARESVSLHVEALSIDLVEFDRCYAGRSDVRCCERAAELYSGPLLWQECYDWTDEKQSWYEIRYAEVLNILAAHRENPFGRGGKDFAPAEGRHKEE